MFRLTNDLKRLIVSTHEIKINSLFVSRKNNRLLDMCIDTCLLYHCAENLFYKEITGEEIYHGNREVKLDPKTISHYKFTILHNEPNYADFLIPRGVPYNTINIKGRTPLHLTSSAKSAKIMLDYGLDPNIKDKTGLTSLHNACKIGNFELVNILLEYGADPNIKDKFHLSPLFYISFNEILDEYIVEEPDYRISVIDSNLRNVVDIWSKHKSYRESSSIVKILSKYNADMNIKDRLGRTSLYYACIIPSFSYINILMICGASPNIETRFNGKPLNPLASYGDIDMVKLSIKYGAKIDQRVICDAVKNEDSNVLRFLIKEVKMDYMNSKLLHNAIIHNVENAVILIENGHPLNIEGKYGILPLELAIENDEFDLAELLIERGAYSTNPRHKNFIERYIWG